MSRAVSIGFFKPFVFKGSEVVVSHLQYADDTLFIGDACVENLWCIKAILRWFELMSGLKVNFSKSRLMGVGLDDAFLLVASNFLNCKLGKIPFIYLGLPVGANHRKVVTWEPVIEILKNRLHSWKNRFVSLGGRVILINSVLAAIPLFYLSFLKIPLKVWKKMVSIQRNFLWGGSCNKSKIAWVKWVDVCRPKEEGGLGVRDLRLMNISLLAKWRWRLLMSHDLLWKSVLEAKYGVGISFSSELAKFNNVKFASLWWKDLCCLGRLRENVEGDWCGEIMAKKLGSGGGTRFWLDKWLGPIPLCDLFPRLFSVSTHADKCVSDFGDWRNEVWCWMFRWRRQLFVWEGELLSQLLELLSNTTLTHEEDSWVCTIGDGGVYTVKNGYCFLASNFLPEVVWREVDGSIVKKVWDSFAPTKVVIFS
jgi:hypothetical protein